MTSSNALKIIFNDDMTLSEAQKDDIDDALRRGHFSGRHRMLVPSVEGWLIVELRKGTKTESLFVRMETPSEEFEEYIWQFIQDLSDDDLSLSNAEIADVLSKVAKEITQ